MFLVYSIQGVFFKNITAMITKESPDWNTWVIYNHVFTFYVVIHMQVKKFFDINYS